MFRFSAVFLACLALSACGSSNSNSSGSVTTTGDTVSDTGGGLSDAGGDTAKPDTTSGDAGKDTTTGSDIATQDTGQSAEQIAAQMAAASKAESDIYLAFCKQNLVCDTGLYWSNATACRDTLLIDGGLTSLTFFADGKAAIAAGRATFDAATLAECLASFDAKCTFLLVPDVPAACSQLFKGLVDNAFACTYDQDCKSGFCKRNAANDPECLGTCAAKVATGAICISNAQCPLGNICNVDGKCVVIKAAAKGESCLEQACQDGLLCAAPGGISPICIEKGTAGTTCTPWDFICTDGFYCKAPDASSDGVCSAVVAAGDTCDKDGWYNGATENPCGKKDVCVDQPAGVTPTGATCKPVVKVGEACLSSDQCDGYDQACFDYQDGTSACDYLPALGDACEPLTQDDLDSGYLDCLPPFVCDPGSTTCVARPGVGKDCVENLCGSGLVCNDAGKCAEPGKSGAACTTYSDGSSDCAKGLVCGDGDKCQVPVCK